MNPREIENPIAERDFRHQAKMERSSWKTLDWGECPECGSDAEVFTDNQKPNYVYDGDKCRCTDCGLKGSANTDGEDEDAYIDWHY